MPIAQAMMSTSCSSISASKNATSSSLQLSQCASQKPPIIRSASLVPRCHARKRRRLRRVAWSMVGSNAKRPADAGGGRRVRYSAQIVMRPDILNPLFAEVTALKGVGAALAKPLERLGLRAGRRRRVPPADRLDRPCSARRADGGRCGADDRDHADAGRLSGEPRARADAGAGDRRARQLRQPGLFRRQSRAM